MTPETPPETPSAPLGALVGYIRVSTAQQTHDAQHDALSALGVVRIFADKAGGQRADRPGFVALLDYVRPGDVIVVTSLDRFGRSLSAVVNTVADLRERGIYVRTLREGIDSSTAVGRMFVGIIASLAEYERELIKERAAAARQAAHERGQDTGRPRKLTPEQGALALRMRAAGESVATIRAAVGCGRSTLYRHFREHAA